MLIKINNDGSQVFPYTLRKLRLANPNVSFPLKPSATILSTFGVFEVVDVYPTEISGGSKIVIPDEYRLISPAPVLIDGTWTIAHRLEVESSSVAARRLEVARLRKQQDIRRDFNKDLSNPVVVNGIIWDGRFDSISRLETVRSIAELAGNSSITLFDSANIPHELSLADATAIILALNTRFQTLFARKQSMMVATNDATLDTIGGIVWG